MTVPPAVAIELARHPLEARLCSPVAGVALGAAALLRVLAEVRPASLPDAWPLVTLVLAVATVTAVAEPTGAVAAAGPTPMRRRLAVRGGPVLATVVLGWAAVGVVAPVPSHTSFGVLSGELAVLCALVLAAGALEARARPGASEPVGGAVAVAMAWASLRLLQPAWSPFGGSGAGGRLLLVGITAAVVLVLATSEPRRRSPLSRAGRARSR